MNESRIIELITSGLKIKYLVKNYGISEYQISQIKKKHNLKREYGNRKQDESKKAFLNGRVVYKSRYPTHFATAKKECFSGAF